MATGSGKYKKSNLRGTSKAKGRRATLSDETFAMI